MVTRYPTLVMQDTPRGYWRLGESSGTTVIDTTANASHGTYVGVSTPQAAGAILGGDGARSFSPAQAGYVSIPYTASMNLSTGWAIECWVYVRSHPALTDHPAFFSSEYPGPSVGHIPVALGFSWVAGEEGRVFTGFHDPTNAGWWRAVAPSAIPLNQWVHLMGQYNGTARIIDLYQNGVQIAVNNVGIPASINPAVGATRFIGKQWYTNTVPDAVIDEVALYPFPLGGGLSHYNAHTQTVGRRASGFYASSTTKRWNGSAWVDAAVWRWDGSAWV